MLIMCNIKVKFNILYNIEVKTFVAYNSSM